MREYKVNTSANYTCIGEKIGPDLASVSRNDGDDHFDDLFYVGAVAAVYTTHTLLL